MTGSAEDQEGNLVLGIVCCLVAGVGFGSNYLPVKKINVGDGVWFSVCMSIGILFVGILVNMTLSKANEGITPHRGPAFEWKAAMGGALWMLGNFLCPFIIRWIGLGLGLAVWDCANLLTGWATGTFGLFGVWKESCVSPTLNYSGVLLAMVSLVLLAFATDDDGNPEAEGSESNESDKREDVEESGNRSPLNIDVSDIAPSDSEHESESATDDDMGESNVASRKVSGKAKQVLMSIMSFLDTKYGRTVGGFLLSLLTGFLFGLTFDWPISLEQQGKLGEALDGHHHSDFPMDYVFSSFVGIVTMGVVVLVAYLIKMEGNAFVPRNVVCPAICSGMVWGIAQVAWFQANEELSLVIAFPIISTLPGIIGCLWGYLFFGEFKSKRSRCLALVSMGIRIPAVLLIGISGLVSFSFV
mmetsp:Transcript_12069/g.19100  ORF Transcript_12069/g.19100 Transcript_12069/m.19100 type:complete len:414 (-) Transcript_12069:156-1397(-)